MDRAIELADQILADLKGRGKVERMFTTVREQFLVEVHGEANNPVGHYVADLAGMQEALMIHRRDAFIGRATAH